jgi:hypothetical protein
MPLLGVPKRPPALGDIPSTGADFVTYTSMTTAQQLYERLTQAGEEEARARILADAIGGIEERWMSFDALATKAQVSDVELRLTKEIETLRKETHEMDARLTEKIHEMDGRLSREMKELEVRMVSRMGEFKADTIKWVAGMLVVQTGVIIGVLVGALRLLLP